MKWRRERIELRPPRLNETVWYDDGRLFPKPVPSVVKFRVVHRTISLAYIWRAPPLPSPASPPHLASFFFLFALHECVVTDGRRGRTHGAPFRPGRFSPA